MESNDAVGAGRRAQDLRASLTARLDVESMLAEANAARQAAVRDADGIVAQAQQVSEQLLRDSRVEADRVAAQARAEATDALQRARAAADTVRERAEAAVEEHRRRVRAEVTEQVTRDVLGQARAELASMRAQSVRMISDLEASVQILGVSLETARTHVGDMLARLDGLRAHTAESTGATAAAAGARDEAPPEPDPDPHRPAAEGGTAAADEAVDQDDDPPRTATEAYLRAAHLDFGDPPLPMVDDADVAARYGRDALRGFRARYEPDLDGLSDDPAHDPAHDRADDRAAPADDRARLDAGGAAARPLGWLFRSPS